jgi:soluble lytic murein transglycosylase-like protein
MIPTLLVILSLLSPQDCPMQNPFRDGASLQQHLVAGGSLDPGYPGMHDVVQGGWAGVDTQGTVYAPFPGVVTFAGVDNLTGSNGVMIDGTGACAGWKFSVWHDNNPSPLRAGQVVTTDTVLGTHGKSGFNPAYAAHNHLILCSTVSNGYPSVTERMDGQTVYCIHPSRLIGAKVQNAPVSSVEAVMAISDIEVNYTGHNTETPLKPAQWPTDTFLALAVIAAVILAMQSPKWRSVGTVAALALVAVLAVELMPTQAAATQPAAGQLVNVEVEIPGKVTNASYQAQASAQTGDCQVSGKYPESIRQWCAWITKYAQQNGADPNLISAVMLQESGGNPKSYSSSGAVGLMQIMARDGIAARFMCKGRPCFSDRPSMAELYNPEFNIQYGARMLAGLYRSRGSWREALFAYGPMDMGYYYADLVLKIYETRR